MDAPAGKPRMKMVRWYDPHRLVRTGIEVLISTIFGENADFRLIEALGAPDAPIHDLSRGPDGAERQSIWIDYVADSGDGWNSTYAIAHLLAQPWLEAGGERLPRAGVLIFGGDQVYPTASREEYERRLVAPYHCALSQSSEPNPMVFAIPGNHDWYDSLGSFTRLFCAKEWIGGWRAPQKRSYFALKLPYRWWLVALDMQLGSDVDQNQVEYFMDVARRIGEDDRVIVCNAEPYWIYDHVYGAKDPAFRDKYLHYTGFLRKCFGERRVRVLLAGDLHHYRRHEAVSPSAPIREKITAGGGGAFLHPTHAPDVSTLEDGYELKASFPGWWRSFGLAFRNLLFPFINPWFGLATALLYSLLAWSAQPNIGSYQLSGFCGAMRVALGEGLRSPGGAFWPIATIVGFFLFTDTHRRWFRFAGGLAHGLAHLGLAFTLYWAAAWLSEHSWRAHPWAAYLLIVPAGGYILGPMVTGAYLLVSLNVFGRHSNEAFSSLRIEDWKSFLRMKVDASGLTIYPIGIARVPRRWRSRAPSDSTPSMFLPDDTRASAPQLIEKPIVVT